MKKLKEMFKSYNDWKEQPEIKKRRMILFFGFYFVFFALLIYFIRTTKSEVKVPPVKEEDVLYKTDMIENNNYQYSYYIEEYNATVFNGLSRNGLKNGELCKSIQLTSGPLDGDGEYYSWAWSLETGKELD